jgi:hypothetical protein
MPGTRKPKRAYKDRAFARTEKELKETVPVPSAILAGMLRRAPEEAAPAPAAEETDEWGGHPDSDAQDARFGRQ